MADIVGPETRSRMMSAIRGRDTRPELFLRKNLHKRGFRYRLQARDLPGRPDLVFPRYKAVLFAHGCFWHMHDCRLFKWPRTRREFWRSKLEANRSRDERNLAALAHASWRIGVVWECSLKGPARRDPEEIIDQCAEWLYSDRDSLEVAGYNCQK
ncbi:very short patch repair endonuclease [Roseovarius sp. A46]|uniref:very short patch repair endonuclease n=1 Tax=Roseovarius sp. A46 TaxID=2109331 RepID=UPI001010CDE3|nr:very short patch repair endonuclease [Roseovarius sp. A46]RXV64715.1 very short patch repair endonuclease [Roseovarius sp. A46]